MTFASLLFLGLAFLSPVFATVTVVLLLAALAGRGALILLGWGLISKWRLT